MKNDLLMRVRLQRWKWFPWENMHIKHVKIGIEGGKSHLPWKKKFIKCTLILSLKGNMWSCDTGALSILLKLATITSWPPVFLLILYRSNFINTINPRSFLCKSFCNCCTKLKLIRNHHVLYVHFSCGSSWTPVTRIIHDILYATLG